MTAIFNTPLAGKRMMTHAGLCADDLLTIRLRNPGNVDIETLVEFIEQRLDDHEEEISDLNATIDEKSERIGDLEDEVKAHEDRLRAVSNALYAMRDTQVTAVTAVYNLIDAPFPSKEAS